MAILDLGKVKLAFKGNWASATNYEKDDVVVHNGSVWICTQTHTASTVSEGASRLAPGKRYKSSGYGVQYDENQPLEIFNVKKTASKFFINGRKNPNLTFYKTRTYRFYVHDSTMTGVSFRFCESTDGATYSTGVTTFGTPGVTPGAYVEITIDLDAPGTLRYKQDGTAGVADTNACTVSAVWQGDTYWEEMSRGMVFKSTWASGTQYYRNDMVVYDGNLYLALCDNLGEYPNIISQHITQNQWWTNQANRTNNHVWHLLAGNQWARRNSTVGWLYNKGPINWPYKHGDTQNPAIYRGRNFYISSDGRLFTQGGTSSAGHIGAYNTSGRNHFWTEVPFESTDYWTNEINDRSDMDIWGTSFNPGPYLKNEGWSRFYNRTGERPKVIQVETQYNATYIVLDNGELWHCGEDVNGQGGHGNINHEPGYFMRVLGLQDTKIIKVSTGKCNEDNVHATIALDEDGYVWSWGYNGYGQLGLGQTNYQVVPRRIPREYFDGEEIVDIYTVGTTEGSCYARTKGGYLYAWGRNNVGQLGVGDTTDRWRPTKVVSWDPTTNGQIVKFGGGWTGSQAFIILLDANGYIWHSGYNGYGVAVNAGTTNNSTLARSTVSPTAGNVVDFWCSGPSGYSMLWMRTSNGNTYFCGYGGGYYGGTNTNPSAVSSPTQVQRVQNCVQAFSVATNNSNIRSYWLTESGELWAIAYSAYGGQGNPYGSGASTIEDGSTRYPYRVFLPTGTKIVDMMSSCCDESTNYFGPTNLCLADNGQMFAWGITNGGYITGQNNGTGYPNMVAAKKSFN